MKRRDFIMGTAAGVLAASQVVRNVQAQEGRRYRACIIGDTNDGGYGHNLHLMWGLRGDVDVIAVADPDEAGRSKNALEANARTVYADYRSMLQQERPELVAIGPRTSHRHKEYLLACCEFGAHGIIEKPLAVDVSECDAMIDAANAKSLRWAIAFNFRASPIVQHARQMIMEQGLIGQVLEIRCRGKEDHRAGGEDLIVMGVHCFDALAFFLGEPQWCSARMYTNGYLSARTDVHEATEPLGPIVGDTVHAMYGFANGVTGYFSSSKNADGNRNQWGLDIIGTKGAATIRMGDVPEVFYISEPTLAPGGKQSTWKPLPNAPMLTAGSSPVWHYQPIIDDLIASIVEQRRPKVSIEDGRVATAMVQAAFESHVTGMTVAFPLVNREHPLRPW